MTLSNYQDGFAPQSEHVQYTADDVLPRHSKATYISRQESAQDFFEFEGELYIIHRILVVFSDFHTIIEWPSMTTA